MGNKEEEASCYRGRSNVYESVGEYTRAEEYLQKALTITKEIGHKKEEATCHGKLGGFFQFLLEYDKSVQYLQKALRSQKKLATEKGKQGITKS